MVFFFYLSLPCFLGDINILEVWAAKCYYSTQIKGESERVFNGKNCFEKMRMSLLQHEFKESLNTCILKILLC
ncbi:hypothetical protein M9H77_16544 [Catharanthus roseus]|uniref:Uncharacterized protein n=1 Tax=Catharanthus roseus TaxID=4058 RepID=A0ACC0B215_CATRO|nr:hypothetical protein M9H77_16544 [Catharanthus roseus]